MTIKFQKRDECDGAVRIPSKIWFFTAIFECRPVPRGW